MNLIKFGAYLARLRKERDMPQSRLADMLNITRQAVSKWERGEGFPDIGLLCAIAEIFEMSVDELIRAGDASENQASIIASVSQNQEIAAEILADEGALCDIINIAPYLKVSSLSAIANQLAKHNLNIQKIVELSEFMNDDSVIKLLENCDMQTPDDALLEKLIPFLDAPSMITVLEKVMSGQNSHQLIKHMRPYIGHELIEAAVLQGVLDYSVLDLYWN